MSLSDHPGEPSNCTPREAEEQGGDVTFEGQIILTNVMLGYLAWS